MPDHYVQILSVSDNGVIEYWTWGLSEEKKSYTIPKEGVSNVYGVLKIQK